MLSHFALVLVFAVVASLFVFGALFVGRFLRPRHPTVVKAETYECGEPAVGPGWINFNMRFCLIALVFVIFDVEVALLFPVLAVYKKWISIGNGGLALVEIGLFVVILIFGLAYVWARGDMDWVKKV